MRHRYIQDPETGKLLPAHEWEAKYGPNVRGKGNWQVMPDIKPYQSVIDGQEISSRSTHRAHLKQHNCIEIGNEKQSPKTPEDVPGRREEIAKVAKQLGYL